jgi:cytochrome c-type biogenesis protein
MLDTGFLYFAFLAGFVAFFAPCSFALLPGYITYYLSTYSKEDKKKNLLKDIYQGAFFGLIASLGFFTVFGLAGFSILAIGQFVKRFIPWIVALTALILIIIGILMLLGKEISYFQPSNIKFQNKGRKTGIYLFGIVYAVGSLGCVFPVFLSIVFQGVSSGSFINGFLIILAYILAMSIMMITITTLTFATKYFVLKKLEKILPYVKRVSGIILIIAGIYMIYYQYLLFS